jgi:hypothetical protein
MCPQHLSLEQKIGDKLVIQRAKYGNININAGTTKYIDYLDQQYIILRTQLNLEDSFIPKVIKFNHMSF